MFCIVWGSQYFQFVVKPPSHTQAHTICCNRYRDQKYIQSYESRQLRVGCTFNLIGRAFNNPKSEPTSNNTHLPENKPKAIAHLDWTNLTCIVSKDSNRSTPNCNTHGAGCLPSAQNLLVAKEHIWGYQCESDSLTMYCLCRMAEGKRLSANSIKSILKPI